MEGRTRISGRCIYSIAKGGDFLIEGPRQVHAGIDYPKADVAAAERSTDYWANVFRDGGGWTGYGNDDISAVHGGREFGILRRQGACYVNRKVRVCLWAI